MPRRIHETQLCDVCLTDEDVAAYRIETEDGSYALDLCSDHSRELEALARRGTYTPKAFPPVVKRPRHRVEAIDPELLQGIDL